MRIRLTKISDQRHGLELIRDDGSSERIELVTREALFHDFLHYAVESSLPTQSGFWGTLASGKTMADLNDRTGAAVKDNAEMLAAVEGIVGMMTSVAEMQAYQALARLRGYFETQAQQPPEWCTESFVAAVNECMRRLLGHWRATPYGETMEIPWEQASA